MALPKRDSLIPKPPASDAPLREHALWLAEIGRLTGAFKVFPCVPGDKPPLHNDWQGEATTNAATIAALWSADPRANIGLAIQPGFVAIDADLYKPGAEAALEKFEREHGELPRTLESRTARGGLHLIYCTSKTLGNSRGALPDFGDVRGFGGYIVGPGSIFEGKRYCAENVMPPVDLPPKIEAMLRETRRDRGKLAELPKYVEWDYPPNIARYRHWLEHEARPSIEGQRGNDTLAATAAMGASLALTAETTVQLLAEVFNPRCEPPFEDEDLEKHGASGYRSAEHVGNMACWDTSVLFRAPTLERQRRAAMQGTLTANANTPELSKNDGSAHRFYYLDALDTLPTPEYAIDRILPVAGAVLLYGKRSTQKSFATLDMMLAMAIGTDYHGRHVKRGRVVYFVGEGIRGVNQRVRAWFKARNLDRAAYARDIAIVPFTEKWDTATGRERVRAILRAIAGDGPIAFIAIDTVRRAMSGDENAPSAVGQFLDGVSGICREFDCGHILVHHAGKDESKGARGGGPFEDDADTVLRFAKSADGLVQMTCTKQKDDEADWTLRFRADVIQLGTDAAGKPATSLALALVGEGMATSESPQGDKHADADALALRLLAAMHEPLIRRGDLAVRVMGELAPEIRDGDPNTFEKLEHAYAMHLTRLSPRDALWLCIGDKNAKGQALTFRNPTMGGRRAPKIGRRQHLPQGSAAMT